MSKTQAGSKPAKTTRAKPADKTKAAKPAAKQPRKPAAPSRAKKPATARKPKEQHPPMPGSNRVDSPSLYDVFTVQQASQLYGGLTKSEARKVRRQFYVAGRPDLAAAPRSVSQLLP